MIAFALAIGGCALMAGPEEQPRRHVISQLPAELPPGKTHAGSLLVHVPEAKPTYDTTEMAYSVRPYQLEYFAKNEWSEKPATLIHGLLVQTMRNSGYVKEIVAPPYNGPHRYALRSELIELRQDFTSDKPTLRLSMRFQLFDGASGRVKASRELVATEPMNEKSPYAGVVAANAATARLLTDVARFVLENAG